jgi:hypothetical protein
MENLDSTGSSAVFYCGGRRLVHVDVADTETRCASFPAPFECRHPGIANTIGPPGHRLQPMWVPIEHDTVTESDLYARHTDRRAPGRLKRIRTRHPPAYCTTSYQSSSWPPAAAPEVTAHLLTSEDVPSGLTSIPPLYATNGPSLDEIAVGFPTDPIAEADYGTTPRPSFGINEILGETTSPRAAAAIFGFAEDHIYGDCQYFLGNSLPPAFPLPQSGPHVAALEVFSGTSYSSGAWVVVLGYEGDFVFDLSVGNSTDYPDTKQAVLPTQPQVSQAVSATLMRISE